MQPALGAEVNRHHPLWTLLPGLVRLGAERMQLDPLSPAAVQELAAAVLPGPVAPCRRRTPRCRRRRSRPLTLVLHRPGLNKVGVSSRAAPAAYAARRGLDG